MPTSIILLLLTAGPLRANVPAEVLQAEADRIAVMARAKDPVLAIFSARGSGGGSGVVITADGFALTNFHVAQPSGTAMKCGMADGKLYDAVIVGIDPTGDVALIKLFGRSDFPHAELADSDQIRLGDSVFAMGNPFLLAADFTPTATYGIISGIHRYQFPAGTLLEYTDCLQTDASINPGNSGGPLFDARGRLIGINGRASFEKRGRVSVGVGYAISINQIKNFLGQLRGGRLVDHATLGATVGVDEDQRVIVTDILDSSDAFRRGLRYGDEILRFAGRSISTPNGFKNVLGILPKGWRVPLSYRRDGKRSEILVRLAGVHSDDDLIAKVAGRESRSPMPIPKPGDRPGDKPGGDRKKPKDGDDQGPLPEDMFPGLDAKQPLPEVVKKHYEEKRGYANYYFNRLERDRVWKAFGARGDFASAGKIWALSGTLAHGAAFRLEISDQRIALALPTDKSEWTASDDLGGQLVPNDSGGLFPALYLWHRLAVEGPQRFGELSYLGTAPLVGRDGMADVLLGRHGGVECRFYFDPDSGLLLALEMTPRVQADPCEIFFADYHETAGRWLPQRVEVRHGDETFAVFKIETFALDTASQP